MKVSTVGICVDAEKAWWGLFPLGGEQLKIQNGSLAVQKIQCSRTFDLFTIKIKLRDLKKKTRAKTLQVNSPYSMYMLQMLQGSSTNKFMEKYHVFLEIQM